MPTANRQHFTYPKERPIAKKTTHDQLVKAVASGNAKAVEAILAVDAKKTMNSSSVLCVAAERGHADCLALLLPWSGGKLVNQLAVKIAAEKGHAECLNLLIKHGRADLSDSMALAEAAGQGKVECVKLLLPHCSPRINNSWPLRSAAAGGHEECVKILLPLSNPKDNNSGALAAAACMGKAECVKMLIEGSDLLADGAKIARQAAARKHGDCARLIISEMARIPSCLEKIVESIQANPSRGSGAVLALCEEAMLAAGAGAKRRGASPRRI